jgi:hypothetical protein
MQLYDQIKKRLLELYQAKMQSASSSSTVDFMIESHNPDEIFSSNVNGMETAAPCGAMIFSLERLTDSTVAAGEMPNFGVVQGQDVAVLTQYGSWGSGIACALGAGNSIGSIVFHRLVKIKEQIVPIQVTTFNACVIKFYEQEGNTVFFVFRWEDVEDINNAYTPDGEAIGKYGFTHSNSSGQTAPVK